MPLAKIYDRRNHMKILLLSDTHGNHNGMQRAVNQFSTNADLIVHCGDGPRGDAVWLRDNCRNSTVVCVAGNCDVLRNEFKEIEFLELCGHKIMVTHGHLFSAKSGLERLAYKASEEGADIVFFGHTHNQTDVIIGGVRLINPGSASKYLPTCAVVEMDDKGNVLVNMLNIPPLR